MPAGAAQHTHTQEKVVTILVLSNQVVVVLVGAAAAARSLLLFVRTLWAVSEHGGARAPLFPSSSAAGGGRVKPTEHEKEESPADRLDGPHRSTAPHGALSHANFCRLSLFSPFLLPAALGPPRTAHASSAHCQTQTP